MTSDDTELNEFACIRELEEIKKHAPEYRKSIFKIGSILPGGEKMRKLRRQSFAFQKGGMIIRSSEG